MKPKSTQIYGWDSEPVDERPSELMSTGYSQLSGFSPLTAQSARPAAATGIVGLKTVLVCVLALVVAGGFALSWLAPLLRH